MARVLARTYASADVFVFPSRTDTFGIVLIEALASGLPVAAFPVTGPLDVIGDSGAGALSEDLGAACLAALEIPREKARAHSLNFTWRESAQPVSRPRRGEPQRGGAAGALGGVKRRRFLASNDCEC